MKKSCTFAPEIYKKIKKGNVFHIDYLFIRTTKINMKKSSLWFLPLILLLAVTLFSGCSNEVNSTNEDDDNAPADARGSLISFQLGASDYSNSTATTRAASGNGNGRVVSTSTEKLDDGLEALVEVVENPTAKAITRATSNAPAGKYTILAYKDGVQKAKWVLNYAENQTYTMAEGNAEQYLPAGAYQFYVFNDKVTFSDNKIVKSLANANEDALYYEGTVTIPNTKKHKLSFTLNPVFAQLFFKIKGFSDAAFKNDMSGTFEYAASTIPSTETVDPTTQSSTSENNTSAGSIDVGSFTANQSDNVKTSYIITNNGTCFLPGTDVTKLSFKFKSTAGGTVYGKAVADKTLNITKAISGNLKAGNSYTVYVTIYYSANYLFSDGTVGTLLSNKGKTPVGLVIESGRAISLKNVDEAQWSTTTGKINGATYSYDANGLKKANQADNGYNETRTVSGNKYPTTSTIKGESDNFPAFFAVATTSPVGSNKWYMPGVTDWTKALSFFGVDDAVSNYRQFNTPTHTWGGPLGYQLVEILFYQANGDAFDTWYWTANAFTPGHKTAITILLYKNYLKFSGATKTDKAQSRPFIKY